MRVGVFMESFPTTSETFVLREVTGLLDLGHTVDLYAERRGEAATPHHEIADYGLLQRTRYMNIPPESGYWELPVRPLKSKTWPPGSERGVPNLIRALRAVPAATRSLLVAPRLTREVLDAGRYGFQAESLSALYRLSGVSRGRSCDVAHVHFGHVANSFRFVRALWSAPLVVSFHGYDLTVWPDQHGQDVYASLFAEADLVATHSAYAERRLRDLGCPEEKVRRLPCGIDLSRFPFHERRLEEGGEINVVTVARLSEEKRLGYALRAVAKVRERHPRLRYAIVGEGPCRPEIEAEIEKLGLGDCVTLHGAVEAKDVAAVLERSHIFLLTSHREGTPLSVLEAQASGLPVVATSVGGLAEIVEDGTSGYLVPPHDPEVLAERLAALAGDPVACARMGRAGRRSVEERDERRHTERLVELYEEAMRRYRDGSTSNGRHP